MSSAGHTLRLAELRREDSASFGGKSATLGELIAAGIPVPPGFAVSTRRSARSSRRRASRERSPPRRRACRRDDVDSVGAASHAIGEAMRSAPVPGGGPRGDRAALRRAGGGGRHREPPVAVRSSALGEDGQEATFAGQQETYLWVRGAEGVCDAVRDCWVSLYSAPAITYRARLGQAADEPAMGVAVQLMVDAEVSGVMFTCNPVSGDPSMVAVNASWGLGLAVVGGEVTPDDYLVSKVTGEVVREQVHAKDDRVRARRRRQRRRPRRRAGGAARGPVPRRGGARGARRGRPARRALFRLPPGRRVGDRAGAGAPASLFVLQSRPVTALPRREPAPARGSAMALVMGMFGAGDEG